MIVEGVDLESLLRDCEARLIDSRRSVDEAIDLVRRVSELVPEKARGAAEAPSDADLDQDQATLVRLVLSALERDGGPLQAHDDYVNSLIYRDEENRYKIGRRHLSLTASEQQILAILWNAMPAPTSRRELHQKLYEGQDKASLGTIDVFVSNLRQKLKLAGGGRDFILSTRGQGWALRPEFCRNRSGPRDAMAESEERRSA